MASKEAREAAIRRASEMVRGGSIWLRRAAEPDEREDTMSVDRIVHVCPGCGQYFDSPSVCMVDGTATVVTTIKVPAPCNDGRAGR